MGFPQIYGYEGDRFVAYWWHTGWTHISFGVHVWLRGPNIEVHLPGGFFRFGVPQRWREHRWGAVPANDYRPSVRPISSYPRHVRDLAVEALASQKTANDRRIVATAEEQAVAAGWSKNEDGLWVHSARPGLRYSYAGAIPEEYLWVTKRSWSVPGR